jgi:hypothetical protein
MNNRRITAALELCHNPRQVAVRAAQGAEECYQRATRPCPSLRNLFPNLLTIALFFLGFLDRRYFTLFMMGSWLLKMSGQEGLEQKYENALAVVPARTPAQPAHEQKFDQDQLIRYQGPAKLAPRLLFSELLSEFTGLNELIYLSDLLHTATGGFIPSATDLIERKTESLFRRRHSSALAQLNYDGECSGLGKIWSLMTLMGMEKDFFEEMAAVARAAQSLSEIKLTERQESILKAAHKLQTNQDQQSITVELFGKQITLQGGTNKQFIIDEDDNLTNNLKSIVSSAVDSSLSNPGRLLGISIHAGKGHVINLLTQEEDNQKLISYFDTNKVRNRFHASQKDDCIDRLVALFKLGYRHFFTLGHGKATFVIAEHQADLLPKYTHTMRYVC